MNLTSQKVIEAAYSRALSEAHWLESNIADQRKCLADSEASLKALHARLSDYRHDLGPMAAHPVELKHYLWVRAQQHQTVGANTCDEGRPK